MPAKLTTTIENIEKKYRIRKLEDKYNKNMTVLREEKKDKFLQLLIRYPNRIVAFY